MSFPQLDLPSGQHARTRAALVETARTRRRSRLTMMIVPVAVVAAVGAIVAGGLVADRWFAGSEPSTPATTSTPGPKAVKARCNDLRPGPRSDAKGLTYVLNVPAGWTAKASVDLVRYCAEPRPVAEYSDSAGQNVQIFRGFSTRTAAVRGTVPAEVAIVNESPLSSNDYGANVDVPYKAVDVGGVQGRLIRRDTLAWQVRGQWWTVVGVAANPDGLLAEVAAGLRLTGTRVTWPGARAARFHRAPVDPQLAALPEGSWQPQWSLCLMERPGRCAIAFRAARWNWWSPNGDSYPPQQAIMDRFRSSGGGGWTTPSGVVQSHWYGPDTAIYRKAIGSQHLAGLNSRTVTRLLVGS